MKNYKLVCFSLVLLLPLIMLAQNFNPKSALPKSLDKYSFGMSLGDFIKKNKSATASESGMSFRIEYNEKDAGKDIKEVTSYFDNENNKPLYEIIIEFKDQESLNSHCSKKLGTPNDDDGKWK